LKDKINDNNKAVKILAIEIICKLVNSLNTNATKFKDCLGYLIKNLSENNKEFRNLIINALIV
jgi:hypothetical protein